jgi:hypothetical protein
VCVSVCRLQFAYGEDGMDGTFIEKTKFDLMTFSHAEFRMMYHIDLNAYAARGENWMSPAGALSNHSRGLFVECSIHVTWFKLWCDRRLSNHCNQVLLFINQNFASGTHAALSTVM